MLSVWTGGPVEWQRHGGPTPRDRWWAITQEWTMNRDRYLSWVKTHGYTKSGYISVLDGDHVWCFTILFTCQKYTFTRKNLRQSKLLDPSPQVVTKTHREFVDGLLSECRLKVRALMLQRKFGHYCHWSTLKINIPYLMFYGVFFSFYFFRPNGCWWRGWGRKVWNLVREKPTSQACRKIHSSTVCVTYWREPGATVCSWNRSDMRRHLI